jgi:ABC-type transport system substrate-binding protein
MAANYRELGALIYDIPTEPQLSIVVRSHWLGEGFDTPSNLGEWYQYNPERARQLLAEAGYPNGFETTLEYFEYSKELKAIPEYLKAAWAKIGVKVELKSMDYTVFRANVDTAGWQNMSHAFSFPNPLDIDTTLNFVHSKGLGIKTQGGPNDPQLDQWVEAMWASTDQQERMELLKKIRARVVDQVFIIPGVIAPTFTQIQPWVRNFQPRISGFSDDYSSAIYAWIDEGWRK